MCCILFVGYNNGDSVGDDTEVKMVLEIRRKIRGRERKGGLPEGNKIGAPAAKKTFYNARTRYLIFA